MKISEMIENLKYQYETYGDLDILISIVGGENDNGDNVLVQKIAEPKFTYFQVSKETELLIIGD